jgi:wyosine [tRNA(Phe)-imidazoG37] synthetase (radical SAM superfamily)
MFLWDKIAFGPIHSRRLGNSLGINILPTTVKVCSFDCVYCECGWTLEKNIDSAIFYSVEEIAAAMEAKLLHCRDADTVIDSITFSGNGEPTYHPDFDQIIHSLIVLRNKYYPKTAITCLSNATQLANEKVVAALKKIENPILKLDAVAEPFFRLINKPIISISVEEIINQLQHFNGDFILQTLFLKGVIEGQSFNNALEPHLSLWMEVVLQLHPKKVMLYSLDRNTPLQGLEKIPIKQLDEIAKELEMVGISAKTY